MLFQLIRTTIQTKLSKEHRPDETKSCFNDGIEEMHKLCNPSENEEVATRERRGSSETGMQAKTNGAPSEGTFLFKYGGHF